MRPGASPTTSPRSARPSLQAEQGRRLNVRALGTPDVGPGLRQGLEALEHSAVAIRGMFRAWWTRRRGRGGSSRERRGRALGSPRRSARWRPPSTTSGSWSKARPTPTRPVGVADVQASVRRSRACTRRAPGSRTCSSPTRTPAARAARGGAVDREAAAARDGPRRADPATASAAPSGHGPDLPSWAGHPRRATGPPNRPMITPDDETQLMPKIPGNRWNKPRP